MFSIVLLFAACGKPDLNRPEVTQAQTQKSSISNSEIGIAQVGVKNQLLWELQQAWSATAKYQHISNALADGYEDINLPVPNMGHHYMKTGLVDSVFDIRNPELLVYNRDANGILQLVAVEYAVPIDLAHDVAPEGFNGTRDVWDRNTGFGLWLLHAWIWHHNPDGVFNPTNPLVHLH